MSAMKQTMQRRYTDRLPREYTVGPVTFIELRRMWPVLAASMCRKAYLATLRSPWSAL